MLSFSYLSGRMSNLLRIVLFVAAVGYISAAVVEKKAGPSVEIIQKPVEFTLIKPVEREEFGRLSSEKPADKNVQSVADGVKSQLEKQLGAGKVKSNNAITYRRKAVDLARPGGGITGGVVYYIKVEIAPGKYVHENIMLGGEAGAKLSSVEENHTKQDPIKEFFAFVKEIKA